MALRRKPYVSLCISKVRICFAMPKEYAKPTLLKSAMIFRVHKKPVFKCLAPLIRKY